MLYLGVDWKAGKQFIQNLINRDETLLLGRGWLRLWQIQTDQHVKGTNFAPVAKQFVW